MPSSELFSAKTSRSKWSESEWELRMRFLSEYMMAMSKGGCPSCLRARLVSKYTKKHHQLLESKRREGQGDESP